MFDLAKALAPLRIETPALGAIALDLRSVDFLTWLEAGQKEDRWIQSKEFVRSLIKERSVPGGLVGQPAGEAVDALGDDEIEVIAAIIFERAGPSLRPSGIIDQTTGEALRRGPDDSDALAKSADESSSARLLLVIGSYADYHRARSRRFLDAVRRAGVASEFLRKSDTLSSILKTQSLISRGMIGSEPYRQSLLALDQRRSILKSMDLISSRSLFEEHRRLAAQLRLPSSPLRHMQDALTGLVGLKAWRDPPERDRLFGDRIGWADAINRQLRLGLPASVFASVAVSQLATGLVFERAATDVAALLRPGFQTAANMALEGFAARGAVAELLRQYDIAAEDAPILESVRETVTQLDEEEDSPDAFMRRFESAWDSIIRLLRHSPDLIRSPAFVAWLSVLISVAGTALTAYEVYGPPPPEIVSRLDRANAELRSANAELAAARLRSNSARHIRYVHQVVNLRAEPHRHAQLIRLVYPDQPVRILEASGEWAKVEIFDYGSDAPVIGWANRRYLRASPAD